MHVHRQAGVYAEHTEAVARVPTPTRFILGWTCQLERRVFVLGLVRPLGCMLVRHVPEPYHASPGIATYMGHWDRISACSWLQAVQAVVLETRDAYCAAYMYLV